MNFLANVSPHMQIDPMAQCRSNQRPYEMLIQV